MAKTCPRCRLYSPDSAQRCDCGYDFDSGRVEKSYVFEDMVRKHGGVPQLLRATASPDIVAGSLFLAVGMATWVGSMLTGEGRVGPLLIVLPGAWQLARGVRLRRRAWHIAAQASPPKVDAFDR